jgi:hypothetical protein
MNAQSIAHAHKLLADWPTFVSMTLTKEKHIFAMLLSTCRPTICHF